MINATNSSINKFIQIGNTVNIGGLGDVFKQTALGIFLKQPLIFTLITVFAIIIFVLIITFISKTLLDQGENLGQNFVAGATFRVLTLCGTFLFWVLLDAFMIYWKTR